MSSNGSSSKSLKDISYSVSVTEIKPTKLINLQQPFEPYIQFEDVTRDVLVSDDLCVFEVLFIYGFKRVENKWQALCKFATNEGTFKSWFATNDSPLEQLIDCIVLNQLENQLIGKRLTITKHDAKLLEMPQNYKLSHNVGDAVWFYNFDAKKARKARIAAIQPIKYVCQMVGEYEIEMEMFGTYVSFGL